MANHRDTYIGKYLWVAAGESTAIPIKTTSASAGAVGDYIKQIILHPAAATVGAVSLFDGSTELVLQVGGALDDLTPVVVEAGWRAVNSGGWSVTTGADIAVRVIGDF